MEKWALNHPKLGLIELEVGYDSEFLELDPTWPEEPKEDEEIRPVTAESGLKERFGALFNNPSVRARILLNGQVYIASILLPADATFWKIQLKKASSLYNPGLDRAKTSCEGHSEFLR